MSQIGALIIRKDGSDTTWPIYSLGDSSGEPTIFECVKVRCDGATGFVPVTDDAGSADLPFIKVVNGSASVLYGNSTATFAPVCPSYTPISTFSGSPGDFTAGNFDNRYGSPQSNFVSVATPVPVCGESGQSLRHQSSTASTVFSNATYWTAAPGNNIELFAQFTGTSATFNIVIIYFGATAFGSTYRAMFDWGNSMCYLQNGGSTLQSAAISSRPTGQFCNLVVDYRNSSSDLKMDLLDGVNGSSLISGGALVDSDTSHTGSQIGMYVKSSASDPIYVNALRTVP